MAGNIGNPFAGHPLVGKLVGPVRHFLLCSKKLYKFTAVCLNLKLPLLSFASELRTICEGEIRVSLQNQLQGHILAVVKHDVQRLSGPGLTGTIIGAITGTGQGACASVVQLPYCSAS